MILVHGGAGQIAPDRMEKVRLGLRAAAAAGRAVLDRGGTALDAVVAAVRLLEDDPEFGAGIGSAFTREGTVETCASVMDGAKRRAGAVAAVPNFQMPVVLARAVLEAGDHVILAGGAALQYASEIGMAPAAPNGLVTERSMAQFRQAQQHKGAPPGFNEGGGVGAVARDKTGSMAAATSTGGTLYRRAGSVDDCAVPGAGTWADENCAVSTSGGEALFRVALANNIAMRVEDGASIRAAAKTALTQLKKLSPKGAVAGAIMVSKDSWSALNIGPHMPVAWIDDFGPNEAIGFEL